MAGPGFAVIDVETTGFSPKQGDRIVEIAIVHVSPSGEIEGAWDSLIDPGRDVGPTRVHGITARDVVGAPAFADLAARIMNALAGRVLVAHNLEFDTRFLFPELQAAESSTLLAGSAQIRFPATCTMRLASEFFPGSARSLDACCEAAGIARTGSHRASVDAADTAALLSHYLARSSSNPYWPGLHADAQSWLFDESAAAPWFPRESVALATERHFVERISLSAPPIHAAGRELDYLGILDRALLDGFLSLTEQQELVDIAGELGLSRTAVEHLHRSYIHRMVAAAWADGVLTVAEVAELESLARVLDVSDVDFGEPTAPAIVAPPPSIGLAGGSFHLQTGDIVVLTGDMEYPRDAWVTFLSGRGVTVAGNASKRVKLVVAADPDTQSGKARRARELGIPIVTEGRLVELAGGTP